MIVRAIRRHINQRSSRCFLLLRDPNCRKVGGRVSCVSVSDSRQPGVMQHMCTFGLYRCTLMRTRAQAEPSQVVGCSRGGALSGATDIGLRGGRGRHPPAGRGGTCSGYRALSDWSNSSRRLSECMPMNSSRICWFMSCTWDRFVLVHVS